MSVQIVIILRPYIYNLSDVKKIVAFVVQLFTFTYITFILKFKTYSLLIVFGYVKSFFFGACVNFRLNKKSKLGWKNAKVYVTYSKYRFGISTA